MSLMGNAQLVDEPVVACAGRCECVCRARPGKDATKKEESDFPFAVAVGDVYEGPLDLLLDLIRKQDIDIYDIPIAQASRRSIWRTWRRFANWM